MVAVLNRYLLGGGWALAPLLLVAGVQCGSNSGTAETRRSIARNDLNAMETATLTINGHGFLVWLTSTAQQREYGLMQVTAAEMAAGPDGAERGMLFLFDREQVLQFWMKDTIIPLDIAFLRSDGQIVQIHTMAPLETRLYSSVMPASMAVEVSAGTFHRLGIAVGDTVQIPDSVLKRPRS